MWTLIFCWWFFFLMYNSIERNFWTWSYLFYSSFFLLFRCYSLLHFMLPSVISHLSILFIVVYFKILKKKRKIKSNEFVYITQTDSINNQHHSSIINRRMIFLNEPKKKKERKNKIQKELNIIIVERVWKYIFVKLYWNGWFGELQRNFDIFFFF